MSVAAFVQDNLSTVAELDINPLILREEGQGVAAVDALISMYEARENESGSSGDLA